MHIGPCWHAFSVGPAARRYSGGGGRMRSRGVYWCRACSYILGLGEHRSDSSTYAAQASVRCVRRCMTALCSQRQKAYYPQCIAKHMHTSKPVRQDQFRVFQLSGQPRYYALYYNLKPKWPLNNVLSFLLKAGPVTLSCLFCRPQKYLVFAFFADIWQHNQ